MAEVMDTTPVSGRDLTKADYKPSGELKSMDAELNLVVGAAGKAEAFIANKQWNLLWRDADLLFQSPRPISTYENTYVLEPNVQRFTVAKVVNAIVPQLYKGLFYSDPPMLLRPRPGTSQNVIDAKTALFSYILDECMFKTQTKWGLEHMGLFGTGIWKWGIAYKEVETVKRTAQYSTIPTGPDGAQTNQNVPSDAPPKIDRKVKTVPRPFIEHRPLDKVLVDPKCSVGDITHADFAADVRYMDFYQLQRIKEGLEKLAEDDPERMAWKLPKTDAELMKWWLPDTTFSPAPISVAEQATYVQDAVHHSEEQSIQVSPDVLFTKFEVLEYWDRKRKIIVLDRKRVIYSGENPFKKLPFLSANWWNRPKALYGMGLGIIVGQNQRVDQGTINAILKILSFGVNPIYLRKRDSNAPTQMIRTGLGKILTIDGEVDKAYKLLETPRVPPEVWAALSENEKATESSSGADQMLVQGSTSGPRSSMGRTAGGAAQLGAASATRLDGPLDNFIEQVFKPFLWILDELCKTYLTDAEIFAILGQEMGKDFAVDLQDYHDAKIEFEVLAGSSLAAKRTMAQSMTLITQIFENPTIQENLADINGEYIDFKEILKMWMEATEWKNRQDIIKPLTPEMKQKRQQKSEAAQAASKAAMQSQSNQQKFEQKQQLEDQANDNRIKRDVVREAFRDNSKQMATEGTPDPQGLGGQQSMVV